LQEEISRNIAELDQLIDEILLASRLDARESDMGTVESVDLTGLVAEECARTGAELDVDAAGAEVLVIQGVPKLLRRLRAQPAGKRAPLRRRRGARDVRRKGWRKPCCA
jgi:signal transduction histidine kinase